MRNSITTIGLFVYSSQLPSRLADKRDMVRRKYIPPLLIQPRGHPSPVLSYPRPLQLYVDYPGWKILIDTILARCPFGDETAVNCADRDPEILSSLHDHPNLFFPVSIFCAHHPRRCSLPGLPKKRLQEGVLRLHKHAGSPCARRISDKNISTLQHQHITINR